MSSPYLGMIIMFGGNFAIRSWAFCNGQLLSIAQNTALFSLLGTTYGGNGQTTFGLPNLQGRVPMHWGSGAGLTPRVLGESAGVENVTLITNQIPAHNHTLNAKDTAAGDTLPNNNVFSEGATYVAGPPNAVMNPAAIGLTGGNQPHTNVQPFQCVTFLIALQGIFPSRS